MNTKLLLYAILIPFAGTALGSAAVYIFKDGIKPVVQHLLLGFAAGVMVAASYFSLLAPGIELAGWLTCCTGFLAGIAFLLLLDHLIPHAHNEGSEEEGLKADWTISTKLFMAMVLHNVPEGIAVGIVFASVQDQIGISLAAGTALAIGIAIQNVPEGAVLSLPLYAGGLSRNRAFLFGALSGIAEPLGAAAAVLASGLIKPLLPWLLCFAAGCMLYVTVEELIPSSQSGSHSNLGTIAFAAGFVIMMAMDMILG